MKGYESSRSSSLLRGQMTAETLIEEQGRLTYKQQLRSKEMQGYDVTDLDSEEKYQEWKRENVGAVIKLLKTAFTIKV